MARLAPAGRTANRMAQPLPPIGRAYVAAIIALGGAALGYSGYVLVETAVSPMWLVLLALTMFSSTFSIKIPHASTTISVSETFVFICALLFGPAPATIVIAVDGLVMSCWRRHRRVHQVLFNAAEPALSIFVAAHVFFALTGLDPSQRTPIDVGEHFGALVAFTSTYFLLNSGLNALVVSIHHRAPFWPIWRQHFGWVLLNYFGATSVAALLVHNTSDFNFVALGVVVPLLVISYLTFKTSMARVEDANAHLAQLNKLYLSTIETLAMAVDAKDQITHGHIRRVQAYAVGLAKAIGLTDDVQLKALEAAALLHDMGKLAIPEHILNKPGKLSAAEFEKMKKHASIGADILSAIDFPYPVVPIVRHHHERWDGKGYPHGLSGAEIPIGARILSVVDCFDALTSDRPYRRALSDDEALQVLLDDRGTAYDPLIVDTFARVHRDIAPRELDFGPQRDTLKEIAAVAVPAPPPTSPGPFVEAEPAVAPILDSLHAFSAQTLLTDAAEEVGRQLRLLTPATTTVFFVHDPQTAELVVAHASGADVAALRGARMPIGDRVSGWVAAHRRTMVNSDPALDLSDLGPALATDFHSCLSTPLVGADGLVGVLTLYAAAPQAFTDVDRRIVEQLARPLAHLVRGALEFEKVQQVTGSSAVSALPDLARTVAVNSLCPHPVAAIALSVMPVGPEALSDVPEQWLSRAAVALRRDFRATDGLYRDGPYGLLAVLPHANEMAARAIADRARDRLLDALASGPAGALTAVSLGLGVATAPADGERLGLVVEAARRRALPAALHDRETAVAESPRQAMLFEDRELRIVRAS